MTTPHLILFSDLDGTLLDHDTYDWSPAQPALDRLAEANIPLILNSSKTAAEIQALRTRMKNHWPYIVENGAAAVIPARLWGAGPEPRVQHFGASGREVLAALSELRSEGFRFHGFSDMSVAELAEETGLSRSAAERARARMGTEPLLWQGTEDALWLFESALAARDLRLVRGGRFFHAMGQFDKADGVRFLLDIFRQQTPDARVVSIALGDSPNDAQMLQTVNRAVVIRGTESDRLILPPEQQAMYSQAAGPQGWNDCVLALLDEFGV